MCLSAAAFAAFIALLDPARVTEGEDRVVIHAEAGRVVWTPTVGGWCSDQGATGREFS